MKSGVVEEKKRVRREERREKCNWELRKSVELWWRSKVFEGRKSGGK